MRAPAIALAFAVICTAVPFTGHAAEKIHKIYMVTWRGMTDVERGFQGYLAERGFKVDYTVRDAGQDPGKLPGFVAEIKRLKPDVVYTWGTTVTLGIAGPWDGADPGRYVTGIPVVFTLVAKPVGARLAPATVSSRRNLTGVSHLATTAAQIAAIRGYRPFRKLGVLYNAAEENSLAGIRELRELAGKSGFALIEKTFITDEQGKPTNAGIELLIKQFKEEGADWLYLGPDTFLFTQINRVTNAAREARLPTFAATQAVADAPGVLAGLVSNYLSVGQFTGYKAERILRGARPQDLPIETLSRFSLVVRLDVARELGLPPPLAMFNYAEMR